MLNKVMLNMRNMMMNNNNKEDARFEDVNDKIKVYLLA